jgi:hypothetical protein
MLILILKAAKAIAKINAVNHTNISLYLTEIYKKLILDINMRNEWLKFKITRRDIKFYFGIRNNQVVKHDIISGLN